jgi:hypothetical protein
MVMPKTMYREWDRLNRLNHLYVKDGRVVCAGENLFPPPRKAGEGDHPKGGGGGF